MKNEDIRVMHAHDGTGEPVKSSASTHTVEEFVLAEHRGIASSNADNKFNLATAEFDGETITWRRRSQLDSEDREPPNDKHFKVIFNNIEHSIFSAKNQKMRSKLLETLNYAR